jgi:hypothetical protein
VNTNELWGSTLTSLTFDPVSWTLTAQVEIPTGGRVLRRTLQFDDVTALRAERQVPLPWNHAELTEVHVSQAPGGVLVELILWDDDTTLTVRCSRLRVTSVD